MRRLLLCAALLSALLVLLSPVRLVIAQPFGDAAVLALLTSANARAPIFSLNFSSDPSATVGSARAFTWALTDPADTSSSVSQFHQGVVLLNGSANSWVDLSSSTSANSAGATLPVFGGNNGSYSFEVVFKVPVQVTSATWPKIFFLGTPCHPHTHTAHRTQHTPHTAHSTHPTPYHLPPSPAMRSPVPPLTSPLSLSLSPSLQATAQAWMTSC